MNSWKHASLALTAFAAVIAMPAAVHAAPITVFSENFDAENGGMTQEDYNAFAQFNVTDGRVDLVRSGDFGGSIECAGGTGSCVDLDGRAGFNPAARLVSDLINLVAGASYTFSFDFSGGQVLSRLDVGGATDSFTVTLGSYLSQSFTVGRADPWATFTFSFVATISEAVTLAILTPGASDFVGAKVDNFLLVEDASPIPAPGAFLLLASGVAGLGFAARRRKASA